MCACVCVRNYCRGSNQNCRFVLHTHITTHFLRIATHYTWPHPWLIGIGAKLAQQFSWLSVERVAKSVLRVCCFFLCLFLCIFSSFLHFPCSPSSRQMQLKGHQSAIRIENSAKGLEKIVNIWAFWLNVPNQKLVQDVTWYTTHNSQHTARNTQHTHSQLWTRNTYSYTTWHTAQHTTLGVQPRYKKQ